MTVFVNFHEAKTHLSRLLEQAAARERSKSAIPSPNRFNTRRLAVVIGGLKGRIRYSDEDWDSADDEITKMFYGDSGSE